jgi:hypothetical protein
MSTPYQPPVAGLLELGDDALTEDWIDYLALGLGPEHVPELIRLATDEQLNAPTTSSRPETWAPTHAWRALGQLRAESAVEPLLELAEKLEDGLYTDPEMAPVFGMIGRAAIPALARALADDEKSPEVHILAVWGLEEIGTHDESARDELVPPLLARMEKWEHNTINVNGFLVDTLTGLRVMEAVPLMEQAFAADRVNLLARGDWEDVQVQLGLIEDRRERRAGLLGSIQAIDEVLDEDYLGPASGPASRPRSPDARAKKARRKQQKESRKKNRRRK